MSGFNWDDHPVVTTDAKAGGFNWDDHPVVGGSAPADNAGFDWGSPLTSALKGSIDLGLTGLQKVGSAIDRYSGAPTRAGLLSALKGNNPLPAAWDQFNKDPSLAPTGKDIAHQLGVGDTALSDVVPSLYHEKGQGTKIPVSLDELKSGQYSGELGAEKGGLLDPTASGAVGLGVDVAADPVNLIPVSKLAGVGKLAEGLKAMPESLKALSEGKAIKQAGGMLKDFRRLMGKDKVEDVGQALLRGSVDMADESGKVKSVPLMSAGDDVEAVAEKAALKKQQVGQELGQVYKDSQEAVNKYIEGNADPKVLDKLSESTPSIDTLKSEVIPQVKGALRGQAKSGPVKAVEGYLNDLVEDYGNKPLDLLDLHEIKSKVGKEINWNRAEFPNRDVAFRELYKNISNKIDSHMDVLDHVLSKSGDESTLNTLKSLNKDFSIMTDIDSMASDKVARNAANRMLSPSDYGVGLATGAATTMAHAEPVTGLLAGVGSAVANKVAREKGAGIIARGADVLSRGSQDLAPMAGQALQSIRSADQPIVRGLLKKAKGKQNGQ